MTLQDLLSAYNFGSGPPGPAFQPQQPVPFSSSPVANAMKKAFNFITVPPAGATPAPADTGPIQPLGSVKNLLPALMAGSGASQATPQNSAPAVPLPQPRPAMPKAPGAPMNITPPGAAFSPTPVGGYNPGLSAVSGAAEGSNGFPAVGAASPFNAFKNAFSQTGQQPTQAPQGIIPRLVNDIGAIKKLFAGGPQSYVADNAIS